MRPATSHVRFSDVHRGRYSSDDQLYEEQRETIPRSTIRHECMAPDKICASLNADEIRDRCDTIIAPVESRVDSP